MSGKKIHFIGIGGVGMAGLAVLLKAAGNQVSGCDLYASRRTRWLESLGIPVAQGHDPAHVADVDVAIVTPAVPAGHPELRAARRTRYRGEVLAEIVCARESIAVCGSHGKTTTATYITKLLRALGEDVAWAIGGETGALPVAGTGKGVLVVEADESDGTLALYRAKTLVVTNCEYDHPDHFKTPEAYFACYEAAKNQAGEVIASERLDLSMLDALDAVRNLAPHNRRNVRAAIEVALRRGHSLEAIGKALPAVVAELPDRRFQRIWPEGAADGRTASQVVTDYAHHPTELRCAVGMARARCPGKLRVLFQPHRYSRTKALVNDFPAAFEGADEVVLCPTYAAFEHPVEGGDIADLYRVCREWGRARFFLARSCDEAWEHARNSMQSGDWTLLLGAGDIIKLVPKVVADLAPASRSPDGPVIFIGAGSNTWKSDLNLSVRYIPTDGPASRPGATLVAAHPTLIPWMAGIPGTIGGWIKMNAGAFGHSISEVLESVKVDGAWIPAAACGFGYRTSAIAGEIQDCRLRVSLKADPYPPEYYLAQRTRFPPGTKGSVFKNPQGESAGRLLEAAGCKGLRVGGAYVWSGHANVIVSGEGAVSSDFLALARLMRERVRYRTGIVLEPEVQGLVF
ncbi:MAG: Mur ligase domain-containing protein [Kiritimatiellia bacterium]